MQFMMKKLLNDGWEFLKLPEGSTPEEARRAAGWRAVDLPHDWLINWCKIDDTWVLFLD